MTTRARIPLPRAPSGRSGLAGIGQASLLAGALSFALILTLTSGVAGADPWWGEDKAKHLAVGVALGGASYGGLWLLGDDPPAVRLGLSCFMAMLPGVAKELYDMGQPGNIFSYRDLFWTGVGALVGSGAVFAVDLLLRRLAPRSSAAQVQLAPAGAGVGLRVLFR